MFLIKRNPRLTACSGRMLALALKGRNPRMTDTFLTSQPSRNNKTLTIALDCWKGSRLYNENMLEHL
jgi:hypothetical protein